MTGFLTSFSDNGGEDDHDHVVDEEVVYLRQMMMTCNPDDTYMKGILNNQSKKSQIASYY